MDPEISEQLARRDRLRKHLAARMTPEERLCKFEQMQRAAWELLVSSPDGYAHFMRRNFKARAIRTSQQT